MILQLKIFGTKRKSRRVRKIRITPTSMWLLAILFLVLKKVNE